MLSSMQPVMDVAMRSPHSKSYAKTWKDTSGHAVEQSMVGTSKDSQVQTKAIKVLNKLRSNTPSLSKTDVPGLEKELRSNPSLASVLNCHAVRLVNRSIFSDNMTIFKDQIKDYEVREKTAMGEAEFAHQVLQSLGEHKGKDLDESFYLDGNKIKAPPVHYEKNSEQYQQFRKVQNSLIQARKCRAERELAEKQLQINKVLVEVTRHPSYRALARVVNANMRGQMMNWLNIIGMLTMVATLPLMYEGLKQWVQSMHQPQQSGSAQ